MATSEGWREEPASRRSWAEVGNPATDDAGHIAAGADGLLRNCRGEVEGGRTGVGEDSLPAAGSRSGSGRSGLRRRRNSLELTYFSSVQDADGMCCWLDPLVILVS